MCRRRQQQQQEDTTPFDQADIDAALEAERAELNAKFDADNNNDLDEIKESDTEAVDTTDLETTVAQMGGSMAAMKDLQEQSFRHVKDAEERERLAIKRRKKQQLQRAIRQRKQTGLTGRRSLITGTAGGKGYA